MTPSRGHTGAGQPTPPPPYVPHDPPPPSTRPYASLPRPCLADHLSHTHMNSQKARLDLITIYFFSGRLQQKLATRNIAVTGGGGESGTGRGRSGDGVETGRGRGGGTDKPPPPSLLPLLYTCDALVGLGVSTDMKLTNHFLVASNLTTSTSTSR